MTFSTQSSEVFFFPFIIMINTRPIFCFFITNFTKESTWFTISSDKPYMNSFFGYFISFPIPTFFSSIFFHFQTLSFSGFFRWSNCMAFFESIIKDFRTTTSRTESSPGNFYSTGPSFKRCSTKFASLDKILIPHINYYNIIQTT